MQSKFHRATESLEAGHETVLGAELTFVQQMMTTMQQLRHELVRSHPLARSPGALKQLANDYLDYVALEERLDEQIGKFGRMQKDEREKHQKELKVVLENYSFIMDGLIAVGGAAFVTVVVLIFSAVRGALGMLRWSSLLFAMGFFLPMLVQGTARFKPVLNHVPPWVRFLIPTFVIINVFTEFIAFVLLYIAAVALDWYPETTGAPPTLVLYPIMSEDGNYVPGFVMGGALIVVGSAWVWGGISLVLRWWGQRRSRSQQVNFTVSPKTT